MGLILVILGCGYLEMRQALGLEKRGTSSALWAQIKEHGGRAVWVAGHLPVCALGERGFFAPGEMVVAAPGGSF